MWLGSSDPRLFVFKFLAHPISSAAPSFASFAKGGTACAALLTSLPPHAPVPWKKPSWPLSFLSVLCVSCLSATSCQSNPKSRSQNSPRLCFCFLRALRLFSVPSVLNIPSDSLHLKFGLVIIPARSAPPLPSARKITLSFRPERSRFLRRSRFRRPARPRSGGISLRPCPGAASSPAGPLCLHSFLPALCVKHPLRSFSFEISILKFEIAFSRFLPAQLLPINPHPIHQPPNARVMFSFILA